MPDTETLTPEQVAEIEARLRQWDRGEVSKQTFPVSWAEADALCRSLRAAWASDQHNYDLWLTLKERHAHKFSNESGAWADICRQCGVTTGDDHDGYDCIAWIQRQNAALRTQNQSQPTAGSGVSTLIGYEAGYSDGRDACVEKVKSVAQAHREMAEKLKGKAIGEMQSIRAEECDIIADSIQSLTLDQVQEKR